MAKEHRWSEKVVFETLGYDKTSEDYLEGVKMKRVILLVLFVIACVYTPSSRVYASGYDGGIIAYQKYEEEMPENKKREWVQLEYKIERLLMEKKDKIDLCCLFEGKERKARWSSDNTNIASVSQDGVVTAISDGETEIRCFFTTGILFWKKEYCLSTKVCIGQDKWNIYAGISANIGCTEYKIYEGNRIVLKMYNIPECEKRKYSFEVKAINSKVADVSNTRNGIEIYAKQEGNLNVTYSIVNTVTNKRIQLEAKVYVIKPQLNQYKTWNNKYYLKYGDDYVKMFVTDVLFLPSEYEDDLVDAARKVYNSKMESIFLSGIVRLTDFTDMLETAVNGVLNGGEYENNLNHLNALGTYIEAIKTFEGGETTEKTWINRLQYYKEVLELANEIDSANGDLKILEGINSSISTQEKMKIIGYLRDSGLEDITKICKHSVNYTQYCALIMSLYETDVELLVKLQKCSEPGDVLYKDVERLRAKMVQNPETYVKDKFINEARVFAIEKLIDVLVNHFKNNGSETLFAFTSLELQTIHNILWMVTDMNGIPALSEYSEASILMMYYSEIYNKIGKLRLEIKNNYYMYNRAELLGKIEEYQEVYELFLAIIEPLNQAVENMVQYKSDYDIYEDMLKVTNGYDYDMHISNAMAIYAA